MRLRPLVVVPLVALLLPLSACSSDADDEQLTVLAAASLTETFARLAAKFEEGHEGVDVKFSFGSSTTLAEQVVAGAPGDVLATADEESMDVAVDGGALAGDPERFATNDLVLVVPADNPADIDGIDDLSGTDWVRCADDVPCGRLAISLLQKSGVAAEPKSLEVDVKSTLTKVVSDEADAGFVYATDAAAAGDDVQVIEVPGAAEAPNPYFIATLDQNDSGDLAADWVDFVGSDEGQQILSDAGFGTP